ncbi:MAG: hypothetical protein AAF944_26940 [Bacteroidota bacterium]
MIKDRLIIVVFACLVFVVSNVLLSGYMASYQSLGDEIAAPADALHEWHLNKKAPFEYRMLFPAIVLLVWKATGGGNTAFYWSYVLLSLVFLTGSALVFFQLLLDLRFSRQLSLAGVIIFLLLPPLLLAYTLPVHTREDTLAYIILCLGLLFLLRKQYVWFFGICLIGVLCRETLLILPFVFLFFSKDFPFWKRVFIASLPVVAWLSLRILVETNKVAYDPLEGLRWNLANPAQVVVFAFITFGPLWILWLGGRNLALRDENHKDMNGRGKVLARSAPWTLALIIVTTFLGGIYNEIRLLYLGFPWVISLSLFFIKAYRDQLRSAINARGYIGGFTGVVLLAGIGGYFIFKNQDNLLAMTQHDIPVLIWLTVGLVMTTITVATLLLFWFAHRQRILSLNFHE